jgi:hypothetical protein
MKKTNNTGQKHSFSRWVRESFSSLAKHQNCNCQEKMFEKLQDIQDLIEIIAREIARQAQRVEPSKVEPQGKK